MIPDPILLIRLLPPSTSRPLDPLLTRSYITLKMKRAINNEAGSLECKVPCDHNRLNYYKTPILTFCIIPAKCLLVWSRAFHKLHFACNHHVVVTFEHWPKTFVSGNSPHDWMECDKMTNIQLYSDVWGLSLCKCLFIETLNGKEIYRQYNILVQYKQFFFYISFC